jgi:hypothetical protein
MPLERTVLFFADLRVIEASCIARAKLVKKIVLQCLCWVRFTQQGVYS